MTDTRTHAIDDVSEDDEGWWWCSCECGLYQNGPFPGREDATDDIVEHIAAARS